MPSKSVNIKSKGDLGKRILSGISDRIKASETAFQHRHDKWRKAEDRALAYLPEKEVDAERRLLREQSGEPQYTTIQIPYTYAVLMTAHTYLTTVFLARDPIMQFAGRHGETQQQVQALEAVMNYQVSAGGMLVPFYIWLLDGLKYGIGVTSEFWEEEFSVVSRVEEIEETIFGVIPTGRTRKEKVAERVMGYVGNKLMNVRPYDFYPDPRVPVSDFQKGEFCASYIELNWNTILKREELGYYMNIDELRGRHLEPGVTNRVSGSEQLELPSSDSFFFNNVIGRKDAKKKISTVLPGYEICIDLIPEQWGLGKGKLPEKWMFTVSADFQVLVGAQPHGHYHAKYPYNVWEPEPEGYGLTGRGMPEVTKPIQDTIDWLINSHFYNVRATLNNQLIVDPSRVVMKDILTPKPGRVARLKPAAYGTNPKDAYSQMQFVDVTQNHLRDIGVMLEMGQRVSGVNDQIMGMINAGGRRTAQEIRTSTTFGVNRLKTISEYCSAMGWAPMMQKMVQNTQQFFDQDLYFRIAGDLSQSAGEPFVGVSAETIAGFYDYVPVDGTLPVDRFAQANLWQNLFAQISKVPQVAMAYDLGRIFEWVAQLAGLKNITQFRAQVVPDAQAAAQAQQGNLIPLPTANDPTVVPESGQIPNLGTSG